MTRALLPILLAACAATPPKPSAVSVDTHREQTLVAAAPTFVPSLIGRRVGTENTIDFGFNEALVFIPPPFLPLLATDGDAHIDVAQNAMFVPSDLTQRRTVVRVESFASLETMIDATTVGYCVDGMGHVVSVRAPGVDRRVLDIVRRWRFAPYFVDGKPITVCSEITLKPGVPAQRAVSL